MSLLRSDDDFMNLLRYDELDLVFDFLKLSNLGPVEFKT